MEKKELSLKVKPEVDEASIKKIESQFNKLDEKLKEAKSLISEISRDIASLKIEIKL